MEKSPLCDPGSESLLPGGSTRIVSGRVLNRMNIYIYINIIYFEVYMIYICKYNSPVRSKILSNLIFASCV